MKIQTLLKIVVTRAWLMIIIGTICAVVAPVARAGLAIPYAADANTLHLWSLDSTNNWQGVDLQSNDVQTTTMTLVISPGPTNAIFGTPSTEFPTPVSGEFPSLGNAIDFSQNCCAYGPYDIATNADGTTNFFGGDTSGCFPVNTNMSDYVNSTSGAFTWEAVIRPDVNLLAPPYTMQLMCGDSGLPKRSFQWRFTGGALQFIDNIYSGSKTFTVALPTTGPDKPVIGAWYHVAMTYTGNAPTNGDTPGKLTFYWTRLDPSDTSAHVLLATNEPNPQGGLVFFVVSGSGRQAGGGHSIWNQVAGTGGFSGAMQDIRISSVCRHADQMAFNSVLSPLPAVVALQPPATTLVAEGKTLTINAQAYGNPAPTYQWFQGGTMLPGQTNATLVISNTPFAAAGSYDCNVTNNLGGTNTTACVVTVGADIPGLYNSGVDDNGNPLDKTAPGSVDRHWFLLQSGDPFANLPNAIIWGDAIPNAETVNGAAVWIGPELYYGRGAGSAGTADFQIHFYINQGDPASATLTGSIQVAGAAGNGTYRALLNGTETDYSTGVNPLTTPVPFQFTSANGLVAGSNSLDFICSTPGIAAVAAQIVLNGICTNALAPGLPSISTQPASSQIVPYGASVSVPAVALGRPPLSYQWLSNGIPIDAMAIPSAATLDLAFIATNFANSEIVGTNFTANYQLVVSNDSGSVTSAVATVTITIPPLTVASAGMPIWNATNNETNIVVLFSKAVDPVTAATAGNYSLDNGANVSAAKVVSANEVVLTTSVLNPATSYTLMVQNVEDFIGITMSPSPASIAVGTYPATIALWVKANTGVTTNADGVTQWNDLSGNGNNLSSSFGAPLEPQLTTNAFGDAVVRFTATNETFMSANDSPSLQITNDMSIFAVMSFDNLTNGTNGMIVSKTANNSIAAPYDYYANAAAVQFYRGNGTANAHVSSTKLPSTGVLHLLDVVMQGTTVTQQMDGRPNGNSTLSTTIADGGVGSPLFIGTRFDQGNFLSGDMAELIIVGSALSTSDVTSMENYLVTSDHVPIVNTSSTNMTFSITGSQLTLSWPSDHTGWTLQAQTNNLSVGINTNWVDVSGSTTTNQVAIPVNVTNGSVFYRLIYRQ